MHSYLLRDGQLLLCNWKLLTVFMKHFIITSEHPLYSHSSGSLCSIRVPSALRPPVSDMVFLKFMDPRDLPSDFIPYLECFWHLVHELSCYFPEIGWNYHNAIS